ncbi:MAG: dihydrolipoyllysine-residue succinyltransferase [Thiobacillaceae bacterium]|nr:dihydrolipoyllysine-residue succinyltransferase [Thiobacillaceae bacterium]
MRIEVKTPEFSESVHKGTLLEWRKQPGEQVARDEVLAEVETDKVILEVAAPADGWLAEIRVPAGAEVQADEVLAILETEATAGVSAPQPQQAATEAELSSAAPPAAPQPLAPAEPEVTTQAMTPAETGPAQPCAPERRERRVPMTRLRQRIAERLVEAQHTAAILTTFNEIDMSPVQALRRRYQERFQQEHGVKLGLMSFFVKAACLALKEYPIVNARVDGRDIVYHDYCDIGIAVSSERGLVVPVLRDAEHLSFADIERRIDDFVQRANALKLTIEELEGGTFTISNGGIFGSLLSTPILNPPQSAVLGLHRIQDRPVAVDGQVVIRPMMYVALSYDHRIIDGREAVSFLRSIKESLEDPARLLLEL